MKKIFLYIVLTFFITAAAVFAEEEKLIILDASLSMGQPINGVPKYTLAIEAAKMQLQKIEQNERIGLRTIGLPIDASLLSFLSNPAELCKATQLTAPIKSYNLSNIEAALDSVIPLGTTPLTYSLDTAIKYDFLSGTQTKHIILITDGGESCDENPCEYIKNLTSQRNDILIDVIAIGVNGEEFGQLKCLTDFTSGTIISANNSKQIDDAFSQLLSPNSQTIYSNPSVQMPVKPKLNKNDEIEYKNFMFETYE